MNTALLSSNGKVCRNSSTPPESITNLRRIALVGFGIGLIQLIQNTLAIAVT